MGHDTVERAYEQIVKQLSPADRLRLVERIEREIAADAARGEEPEESDLLSLAGAAPGLLSGEDAQEWVSRTRRESDERRRPKGLER
jgi:hypothetical protein